MQVETGVPCGAEARGRRGLSTARAALQVAWLLARRPEGIRADEVAETLGKSVSTAYNVLASLCEEGVAVRHPGGLYRLAPALPRGGRRGLRRRRSRAARLLRARRRPARAHPQARLRRRRRSTAAARRRRARPARDAQAARPGPRDRTTAPTRSPWARSCWRWAGPEAVERYVARRPARPSRRRRSRTPPCCARSSAEVRRAGVARRTARSSTSTSAAWPPRSSTRAATSWPSRASPCRAAAFDDERPALEETLRDVASFAGRDEPDGGAVPGMCGSARGS